MAADEIASIKGSCIHFKKAQDHGVFDRFCGLKAPILRLDAEAIASNRGASITSRAENDHAVFARCCPLLLHVANCTTGSDSILTEEEEIDSSSGWWRKLIAASAQAVFTRSCGCASVLIAIAFDEIALSRGWSMN